VAQRTAAVGVVHISEAWTIRRTQSSPLLVERPSEAADRQEILHVVLDHRDGRIFCSAPISRDGDAVSVGDFTCEQDDDPQVKHFGRMVNLLGRPEPPEPEA
jgi:hypothetical protein